MKTVTVVLSSALLISAAAAVEKPTVKQEGIHCIKMLGGALKSKLKAKMKEDKSGLTALAFCTSSADEITKSVNKQLPPYAMVRRTALAVRNDSVNLPDATDMKVMKKFESAIQQQKMTPKTVMVVEEGNVTRVYKPLVTKGVCLKCHGSRLSPKIAEAIKTSYPNDKAVGFEEGTLRGVIVAEIKKH